MMDEKQTMQHGLNEIKADWPESSLDEKQNYVLELNDMAADAAGIESIPGTDLLREVGQLRDHIERQILPAKQKREIDCRHDEQELPGERL